MTPDLRQIIDGVIAGLPDAEWEQLSVTHPADDDGIRFFWRRGRRGRDVQIESSSGACPFLIETTLDNELRHGATPTEVVQAIVRFLSE